MNVEQRVERLRASVEAAFEEFTLVMRLYETWRPAAFDQDIFDRMGPSYASHAFLLIREVLAREIVLGRVAVCGSKGARHQPRRQDPSVADLVHILLRRLC